MTTTRPEPRVTRHLTETHLADRHPPEPHGRNLLAYRPVAAIARSRWYPGVLQVPVAAVFGLVAYQLLMGPDAAHDNLGTALMWVLWWPLIPVLFLLVGRFWCAVCPFGALSDLVQRLVGLQRPVPRFLRNYGIWIIDASFILITWGDHVWGVVESPWGSGVLLLILTTAVVASGALYARRTFCRYLCFLGGLSGNYSRTSAVALRADAAICATCTARAACFNGDGTVPPCPLFEFPRTMDSNANCNLCARCVKSCPNDAITLTLRPPTKELWFIRTPKIEQSFLAVAIMGIVLIQNITMLEPWNRLLDWIRATTGLTSDGAIFTIAFVVAIAVPTALLLSAAVVARRGNLESVTANFARFGYALIPLDVAGHVAHNLFHLLAEGKSVVFTALPLVGGSADHSASPALVSTPTIQLLQYALVAIGAAASCYAVHRIARRHHGAGAAVATAMPYAVIVAILAVVNLYLFAQPMAHRM